MKSKIEIVALSDTHTYHNKVKVPDADVVIFAGDLMSTGYRHSEVQDFAKWFNSLPHREKILVAGNHDRLFENDRDWCLKHFDTNVHYLCNSSCVIDGWKFWGSPYTPYFCGWAFSYQPENAELVWQNIPKDTEILITHGPPQGVLDSMGSIYENGKFSEAHLGCPALRKIVDTYVEPKLHIFGHIHNGYGMDINSNSNNVAICNEAYQPVNSPIKTVLYKPEME